MIRKIKSKQWNGVLLEENVGLFNEKNVCFFSMMSFECMCVILLEEIHVHIDQMTEVGIMNKENCEAWGSNP